METDPNAVENEAQFFAQENRVLSHIAGTSGFTFKRGNQWGINPETGEATYDPKFFQEQGYTPPQALFAALHEIRCHLVETADLLDTPEGTREFNRFKQRAKIAKRINIWDNCRTDVKGNRGIIELAPSLAEEKQNLYREKLFPETDFTKAPKHLQFAYAVVRQAMVPDEAVIVDPTVERAIEDLRHVQGKGGKTHDIIALATDPHIDAATSLQISRRYIEPVINQLFEEDVKDRQNSQNQNQDDGQGEGEDQSDSTGQSSGDEQKKKAKVNSQDQFNEDYEDYEKRHPEPYDEEKMDKEIRKAKEAQNASSRQEAGYEDEHGVSRKDIAGYYAEYRLVEQYIEPLREIFRRITEQRKIPIRRLAALKEEGVMIDPGLIVQTYTEAQAGVPNPKTMKDFEGQVVDENIPGEANFYFLYDQSYSMAGEKAVLQRRGAIVAAEALQEGQDMLAEEYLPDPLTLNINTAFMGFGSPDSTSTYKSLSKGLTEQQRVAIFKGLLEFGRVGTNDYAGLVLIENDIKAQMAKDPVFADNLKSGKRKVCVVVTTDGGSNDPNLTEAAARQRTKKKADELRTLGVKVKAIAMAPDAGDRSHIVEVYGTDNTDICESEADYPKSMEEVLGDVLQSLEIV